MRVEEFGDLITQMIVVEASRTFQNAPKDLVFPSQLGQLPPNMHEKIQHVVVDFQDMAPGADAWAREFHQRDSIARGFEGARDEDLVLISDVDEIPKRESVVLLRVCQVARLF